MHQISPRHFPYALTSVTALAVSAVFFLHLLMDKPRNILEQQNPAYLRVLAFNDNGRTLLKQLNTEVLSHS